jgi:Zn-dependent M28 family amino/carboxypeptidase
LDDIPFDGAQAYEYLKQICAIGPRPSGSAGMAQQQTLLVEHFTALGGQVELQDFRARHPQTGKPVDMANIIVHWHPERKERILLAVHYDTRPFPDRDPVRPNGVFVGANDGASGAALLMEMARHMPQLKGKLGVDFVLFDGEELVFREGDPYFLGSEHFAQQYQFAPPRHTYRAAVVLDMIADAQLQILQERNSMSWRNVRPIVRDIWNTAKRLKVTEFIPRLGHEIRDDHIPLKEIGKIPACNVIDFDYPAEHTEQYWHTEKDIPENCSALSLAKVGWVMNEWLISATK